MDKVFKRLKSNSYELKYGNVDLKNAKIQVFLDASFANNKDFPSQLGFIILIVDLNGNCSILSWSSTKCKIVTRSVLAAEFYALAYGYDAGFTIAYTVGNLLGRKNQII